MVAESKSWDTMDWDGGDVKDTNAGSTGRHERPKFDGWMEPGGVLCVFRVVTSGTFSVPHAAASILLGANHATSDASAAVARRVRHMVILIRVNDERAAIAIEE